MKLSLLAVAIGVATAAYLPSGPARAAELPIGDPVIRNGMDIKAVYLQPVVMEPMLPGMERPADIHLEADIHANRDNRNGFRDKAWVPYLTVIYQLRKEGSDWEARGILAPMVADDGPHYGANVKLDGPGRYHLSYTLLPPPYHGFYRHTDKETGVEKWWDPFTVDWRFTYVGIGKKGGY